MRTTLITAFLLSTVASVAIAQEQPVQTLDAQMQNMQSGQTAVPSSPPAIENDQAKMPGKLPKHTNAKTAAKPKEERKPLANEWPASASAPAASASPAAPMEAPAPAFYKARDGEIIDSVGGDAIPALPLTVYTAKSVKYVTGGIGDEEMAQLKSIENDFNMRVLIASTTGVYMGDCTVRVLDSQGAEVLTVTDAGPYFYASLEPGNYTVQVNTAGGASNKITTKVPHAAGAKAVVRF